MRPINSKVLAAVAVVTVMVFCVYGVVKYSEKKSIVQALQAVERRNGWRILVYDGGIQYLDLEDGSLRFVNIQPTSTPCRIGMASLGPNGQELVFSETSCSNFDTLISLDLVTRKRRELLTLPSIMGPRWSPAGDLIAFEGKRGVSDQTSGLFLYKLTDGSLSALIDDQLKRGDFLLSWSPDGRRIVFQSSSDQIKIIDLAVGKSRTIDNGQFPTWSPNGRYITYQNEAMNHVLYDVQTNEKTFILKGGSVSGSLVWSPDSRYLAYSKLSGGPWSWLSGALSASDSYGDLCVLDVQSRVQTRLYRHSGSVYVSDWGKIETKQQ